MKTKVEILNQIMTELAILEEYLITMEPKKILSHLATITSLLWTIENTITPEEVQIIEEKMEELCRYVDYPLL